MELRLGTYNVWGLPEPFADDVSSRMRAIAARLPNLDLDVLLIQEAWTDEVRDTLREGAYRAGFHVALPAETPGGGLMALSRMPISASHFERFRFRGDPERVSRGEYLGGKGFQTLVIEGPDGSVPVMNTHLHARYRRHRPRLNSAVRMAQMLQIVAALRETEGHVVVGGDFNCSPGEAEYEIFRGLTGCVEIESGSRPVATLSQSNFYKRHRTGADKRIDFLFVRPGSAEGWQLDDPRLVFDEPDPIRGKDRSLSDHFGFAARLEVAPVGVSRPIALGRWPDPIALREAQGLLEVGNAEWNRREQTHLRYAGGWALGALGLIGLRRHRTLDRRRFLRLGMGAAAVAALAPAAGYTTLAHVDAQDKRGAFEDAQAVLARFEPDRDATA